MNPQQSLKDFWQFVTEVQSFWKWVFLAATGSSLLDLILNLGPPWPGRAAIAFLTVLVEIFVYMLCYEIYKNKSKAILDSRLIRGAAGVAILFLIYLPMSSHFTLQLSRNSTDAAGFIYTDRARQYLKENPVISDREMVQEKENDVKAIFVSWTVDVTRTILLTLWESAYGCITLTFSVFVALRLKPIRTRKAEKPVGS